jgi:hypothetical protein
MNSQASQACKKAFDAVTDPFNRVTCEIELKGFELSLNLNLGVFLLCKANLIVLK